MVTDSFQRLLARLADGKLHSGEALGAQLGVSRAAIWKHIRVAQSLGVPLQAYKGEGYQLASDFALLDANLIKQACTPEVRENLTDIDVMLTVDSTNSEVMRRFHAGQSAPFAVLSEKQTAGRGRRGRPWYSPFGSSIYLSVGWLCTEGVSAIEGLSLVAGLKVVEALQSLGAKELALKWPNDVYWQNAKLSGILVDVQGDPSGVCQLAIGIGINVKLPAEQISLIDQPWTDLFTVMNADKNSLIETGLLRNRIAASVLDYLYPAISGLAEHGFVAYQKDWQRYDLCYDKVINLQAGVSRIQGRGCGVNSHGAYGIETIESSEMGSIQYYNGGEISVRLDVSEMRERAR